MVERTPFLAIENAESSRCGQCGLELDTNTYNDPLEQWWYAGERKVTCSSCGWRAALADLPNGWPSAIVFPAVTFNNWRRLAGHFMSRCVAFWADGAVVNAHY